VHATGADSAEIALDSSDPPDGVDCLAAPLGGHKLLRLTFADEDDTLEPAAEERRTEERRASLERSARALRAAARRWDVVLPELLYSPATGTSHERVVARIEGFLEALTNTQNASNATVVYHGKVIGSASELDELETSRLAFIIKRAEAEANRSSDSSHGTVYGEDFFATTFYFGACLIAFFSAPYSHDFVRHRARLVTRELSALLPHLDEPPPAPALVSPLPE
jgi:hypothetical protein